MVDQAAIPAALRAQARRCAAMDSPLYQSLLEAAALDLEQGSAIAPALSDWHGDAERDFLPLRLLASVHALAMTGKAPDLAAYYPSCGGKPGDLNEVAQSFLNTIKSNTAHVTEFIKLPPQTNDVRRSGPLLLGFAEIAKRFDLPFTLSEIGTSAGLNLLWDKYRYTLGDHTFGDPASTVHIKAAYDGPALPAQTPHIILRAGCDLRPLYVQQPENRALLESYIWATETTRLATLRSAIDFALAENLALTTTPADEWIEGQLNAAPAGAVHVVYHSAVWPYLPDEAQARFTAAMEKVGATATDNKPLAWLTLEDDGNKRFLELRLRLWNGDTENGANRLLATVHPFTRSIRWAG